MNYIIAAPPRGMPSFWDASQKPPGPTFGEAILNCSVSSNGLLRMRNAKEEEEEEDDGEFPTDDLPADTLREHGQFLRDAKKSNTKIFLCEASLDGHSAIARTYLEGENFETLADQHANEVYMSETGEPYELRTAVFWVKTMPGIIADVGWFPDALDLAEEMVGDGWDPEDA